MFKMRPFSSGCVVMIGLAMCGALVENGRAQSQDTNAPTVAEAARRARELKKSSAKPVRTLTDDNLPPATAGASNPASESPAAAPADQPGKASGDATASSAKSESVTAASPVGSDAPAAKATAHAKESEIKAAIERTKKELAVAEHELDVLQRKAVLDSDAFYSKANYASDASGKAALDADAQQIGDKQKDVAALKAKLAELQALAGPDSAADSDKNTSPN